MNWPRLNTRPAIRRRRSWRPSLEEVEGRQLLSNTPLYVLGTNGTLWLESPGWQQHGRTWVDGNVQAFAADPSASGYLYVEGTDHNLWLESPGWQQHGRAWVDGNVQAFAPDPSASGYLYVEGTNGILWLESLGWQQYGRTWVDGNVRAFAGAEVSDSTYLALTSEGPSGGPGGSPFGDGEVGNYIRSIYPLPGPILAGGVQIARVRVFSGAYIDSIQVTYAPSAGITGQPGKHGGGGGAPKDLLLQPGEYITEVSGRSGDYVDSLTIRTGGSRSQTMTWGGSGGSRSFDYKAPPGTEIVFFWGRSGQYLDAIGVDIASPASI